MDLDHVRLIFNQIEDSSNMDTSCPDGYPSSLDLLETGLVIVLSPLENWKVQLLIIGMVVKKMGVVVEQFVGCCVGK